MLRASALTYTVALSIVPVLALAFSALKGFGIFDKFRPLIEGRLTFGSVSVGAELIKYIERVNGAALGSAGAALLLITVVSTMTNVESAFNTIWRVPRQRSYLRKFSDYLSVLFTVPLLTAAALTVTAVFAVKISRAPLVTDLSPYLMSWAAFFFLFVFFPYTRVQYTAALIGSLIAAVLFQIAQWAFVRFQIGVANYQAIYGALATIPLFLVWIYTGWVIVLFGAEVAAAIQRGGHRLPSPTSAEFMRLAALHVLLRVAARYMHGGGTVTVSRLARELRVDERALAPVVKALEAGGFVVEGEGAADEAQRGLFLASAPARITLKDALRYVEAPGHEVAGDPRIAGLLRRVNQAQQDALESMTLEDFIGNKI